MKSECEEVKRLDKIVDDLQEHWEHIQIFVCRANPDDPNQIQTLSRGKGNWYARYGQIELWTQSQCAYEQDNFVRERLENEEDADDE